MPERYAGTLRVGAAPPDRTRARGRALRFGLAASGALLAAGCSSGLPSAVPSVSGPFAGPTPVEPTGVGVLRPHDCRARGGDQVTIIKCSMGYVEQVVAQAYEPVVAQRGFEWVPPTIVYPDSSAETACGKLSRPSYCPGGRTLVMPLNRMTNLGQNASAYLLAKYENWDQLGLSQYKTVPKDSLEANDDLYGAIAAFAHEYGHHVQNLVGGEERIAALEKAHPNSKSIYSSAIELHADCLAGWASGVSEIDGVSVQDSWSVLTMLIEVGDDFNDVTSGKAADPSAFKHGSVVERYSSFRSGYQLAATPQEPFAGCTDGVTRTLSARAASLGPAASAQP